MTAETIGRCEGPCGLIDHHLVAGECERCRDLSVTLPPDQVDDVELVEDAPDSMPMGDEADVTHVLTLMGAEMAMGLP
jgi:hypothetical protein